MTPTERGAVAEAIAALDRLTTYFNSVLVHGKRMRPDLRGYEDDNVIDTDDFPSISNLTYGDLRRAQVAAASLRAVAPAPADDDPTASKEWNEGADFVMMALCAHLGVDPKKVQWDAATETADGDVAAVIGNIFTVKFGEDWSPGVPADQSDAGREGVIEECAKVIEALEADHGMTVDPTPGDIEFNAAIAHRFRKGAVAIRALASAPSETVGRVENEWAQDLCEHPIEEDALYQLLKAGKATDDDQSRAADWIVNFRERFLALLDRPTVDRDAMREAFNRAVDTIRIWHGPEAWDIYLRSSPEMKQITAALGLLGEG